MDLMIGLFQSLKRFRVLKLGGALGFSCYFLIDVSDVLPEWHPVTVWPLQCCEREGVNSRLWFRGGVGDQLLSRLLDARLICRRQPELSVSQAEPPIPSHCDL